MAIGIALFAWTAGAFHPTVSNILLGLLAARTLWVLVRQACDRLPYLTTKAPTLPMGIKRIVSIRPDKPLKLADGTELPLDDLSCLDTFEPANRLMFSVTIVPYETEVIFIDNKFDKEDKKGFVLSFQEHQHSAIHKKYNRAFLNRDANPTLPRVSELLFKTYALLMDTMIPLLERFVPDIVAAVVALQEHGFVEHLGPDRIGKLLDPVEGPNRMIPLCCKMFLWHLAEEREHAAESTYLFIKNYGWMSIPWMCLGVPVLSVNLTVMHTFGLMVCLSNSRSVWGASQCIVDYVNAVIEDDVLVMWSFILMSFGLSTKDERAAADNERLREIFAHRWGDDLAEKKLAI